MKIDNYIKEWANIIKESFYLENQIQESSQQSIFDHFTDFFKDNSSVVVTQEKDGNVYISFDTSGFDNKYQSDLDFENLFKSVENEIEEVNKYEHTSIQAQLDPETEYTIVIISDDSKYSPEDQKLRDDVAREIHRNRQFRDQMMKKDQENLKEGDFFADLDKQMDKERKNLYSSNVKKPSQDRIDYAKKLGYGGKDYEVEDWFQSEYGKWVDFAYSTLLKIANGDEEQAQNWFERYDELRGGWQFKGAKEKQKKLYDELGDSPEAQELKKKLDDYINKEIKAISEFYATSSSRGGWTGD